MFDKLLLIVPLLCACLSACTAPAKRFDAHAKNLGLSAQELSSETFQHRLYLNHQALHGHSKDHLHVYLDGDGTPWRHNFPSTDPTPRNPLVLRLLAQDSEPALLLGRPCYYGLHQTPPCHAQYWTSHRYADSVVVSMMQVLQNWLAQHPQYRRITLIGYSGGGALAALLASRLDSVTALVTIAANLDVSAWSLSLGFAPLTASLNPMQEHVPAHVTQFHLAGLNDRIVPYQIIKAYAANQANARYIAYPGFTHDCCWHRIWPSVLSWL